MLWMEHVNRNKLVNGHTDFSIYFMAWSLDQIHVSIKSIRDFLIWFYTAQGQNIAMAQISKREAVA